jgi:hypothetical protein
MARIIARALAGIAVCGLIAPSTLVAAQAKPEAARPPFAEARMIIEYNSSDEDVGIQFFLDFDSWTTVKVFAPGGGQIFNVSATGALKEQGGGTELFLESVEPTLDDLPLEEFFDRFPEGMYKFVGRAPNAVKVQSLVEFSHDIPAGPHVVTPELPGEDECAQGVPIPAEIEWDPVTETIDGDPIEIKGYEVIAEHEGSVFDVILPGDATSVTVPAQFLIPGTEYGFEILAIAENGNQTITETCFVTAD